jgi:hypothetical protein
MGPAQRVPEHISADGRCHRRGNGQREVHLAGTGQDAGSEQHGDGRGWHPSLHGKRPDEEHRRAVLHEEVRHRGHLTASFSWSFH